MVNKMLKIQITKKARKLNSLFYKIKRTHLLFAVCYLLFALIILIFVPCSQAIELQGGVKYSVDSARDYIQEGLPDNVNIPEKYYQLQSDNVEKTVYSYNNAHEIIGITVAYINEPAKAYIYNKNGALIYMDKYDKPVNVYPHRGYRYDLDGKLILTSLTVSKNELFRFSPNGSLLVHSVNGVIYDENGNVIGSGK